MTVTFTGIPTTQPIGTFYTAVIPAIDLLTICEFDYRKLIDDRRDAQFMGIQRPFNKKRVADIADYARTVDACFPTCVVIALDERCVTYEALLDNVFRFTVEGFSDPDDETESVPLGKAGSIIDGQHRLKGLEAYGRELFWLPVTVFIGADAAVCASLFSIVNLAQTKVNRSLVYDLFSLAKERSPQKTCHQVVVSLDGLEESPFYRRIKRLGTVTRNLAGDVVRESETLSQATVVRGIMQYISRDPMTDRDKSIRGDDPVAATGKDAARLVLREFYRRGEDDAILDLILNYFEAIRDTWRIAWANDGRGNIINRTNGYDAFMKFFWKAYSNFTTTPRVVSKAEFFDLFKRVRLEDTDFTVTRFPPGSSGASELYRELRRQTGL